MTTLPPGRAALRLAWLAPLMLVLVAGSAYLGPTRLSFADAAFQQARLPRTCLAAAAGAGLAIGGVVFQALFRNPLATPHTLGITSAASLAAAYGFLRNLRGVWTLGAGAAFITVPKLALLAFGGAIVALALVYAMARARGGHDMTGLLLAGVCISYATASGVVLLTFLSDQAVTNEIVVWLMGSVAVVGWQASGHVFAALVLALAILVWWHRDIDLLAFGEELATARGVAVGRVVWGSFALVGVLTAAIVAHCGPIGFVGLMVPHIARGFVGARTLPLLLGSAFVGAAFLAVCDGAARAALRYELPAGVLTNLFGSAFFFYLLARRKAAV